MWMKGGKKTGAPKLITQTLFNNFSNTREPNKNIVII